MMQCMMKSGWLRCALVLLLLPQALALPAAPASQDKPFVQSIPGSDVSFEMIPIPGGTFRMGSPETERGRKDDEGPQVEVEVEPFHMGKFEVTWPEFEAFSGNYHRLGAAPKRPEVPQERMADAVTYPTPRYDVEVPAILKDMGGEGEGFPAVTVSQFAARQYTKASTTCTATSPSGASTGTPATGTRSSQGEG